MIIDIVFNWYCAVKHIHSKITRELAKKIKRQIVMSFYCFEILGWGEVNRFAVLKTI